MDGYGAMARVSGCRVRVLAWGGPEPSFPATDRQAVDDDHDAAGDPQVGVRLAERWERLCDQLVIVTFYLRVPGSWR